jgi:hypothetical protein
MSSLSWKKGSEEFGNHNQLHLDKQTSLGMEVTDELPYDLDKLRKYSADEGMLREPEVRKRTLSLMIDRMIGNILIYIYC